MMMIGLLATMGVHFHIEKGNSAESLLFYYVYGCEWVE